VADAVRVVSRPGRPGGAAASAQDGAHHRQADRRARRAPLFWRTAVPALARHAFAAPGFARRALPTPMRCARAGVGSWLRGRLRGRTAGARLCALFNALFDLETLTQRAARRIARRLTRLTPILAVRPPADALVSCAAPAPLSADTS
jgi:hypothetical protein